MRKICSWAAEILAVHIPNVALVDVIVFVWLSLSRIFRQWSYGLCMLDLYMHARAHWPNVAQIDLTVVFVIVVVAVNC